MEEALLLLGPALTLLRTQGSREDKAAQAAAGSEGALRLWVVSSVCVGVSTSECVTQVPANTILWYKTHPEPLLCPFCLHLLPHLTDSSRASQQRPGEGVAPVPIPFLGRKPPCLHGYKSPFPFQPQGVLASPCSVALALTFVM